MEYIFKDTPPQKNLKLYYFCITLSRKKSNHNIYPLFLIFELFFVVYQFNLVWLVESSRGCEPRALSKIILPETSALEPTSLQRHCFPSDQDMSG